jgi:hypothetical protein
MQHNFNSERVHDFGKVVQALGPPVELDAVRVGSFAHRLRNYWTNIAPPQAIASVICMVRRPEHLHKRLVGWVVQDPDRVVAAVERDTQLPFFPINRAGQPIDAGMANAGCLPTVACLQAW